MSIARRKQAVPISLDISDIDFVNTYGIGKNFSEKMRSIIRELQDKSGILARYQDGELVTTREGVVCVYMQSDEGERVWGEIPFTFQKKLGWKALKEHAEKNNFVCQVIEEQEIGFVAVCIAPAIKQADHQDCSACIERVRKFMLRGDKNVHIS